MEKSLDFMYYKIWNINIWVYNFKNNEKDFNIQLILMENGDKNIHVKEDMQTSIEALVKNL